MNKRTKKFKISSGIFLVLHILCLLGPFLYFVPTAFIGAEIVGKIVLSFTVIASLMLGLLSLFIDIKHRKGLHRSVVWTLILGLLTTLSSIKPFITIMAIVSIVDELIFCPLKDSFHNKYIINKEIDRREG